MGLQELLNGPGLVLFEGAMGTQLERRGAPMGGVANLSHPEAVAAVHADYRNCGVDLLMTNTLTGNRIFTRDPDVDLHALNLAGVALARAAAGPLPVLGDIGSCGKLLKPFGPVTEEEAHGAFLEQARTLHEGGVDGFIVETMMDLREALVALRACREAGGLPVIVTLTFKTARNGGRTMMGNAAADSVRQLEGAGAAAVGANCGEITPHELAGVIGAMRAVTSLPILAKPNAGKPRVDQGRVIYDLPITDFVAGLQECVAAGATMIGGCCGTSPAYIAALKR
ncbi:MAG: hypothetical protein EPO25_13430 [Gammaproteobacteria bacterium]|nr:MAG: hypothetical protein EPO25_13430 [Gammaproteobacteria bacterium]